MRKQCAFTLKGLDSKQPIPLNKKFELTLTRSLAKTSQPALNEYN